MEIIDKDGDLIAFFDEDEMPKKKSKSQLHESENKVLSNDVLNKEESQVVNNKERK